MACKPSEGTAELIERLIVLRLKLAAVREPDRRARLLDAAARVYADLDSRVGERVAKLMDTVATATADGVWPTAETADPGSLTAQLAVANKWLWELKDRQARVVEHDDTDAATLRELIVEDIRLCEQRAALRAKLAARLGEGMSGESIKSYGEVPREPAGR